MQQPTEGSIKNYNVSDFDLLNEGRKLWSKLKELITIKVTWVKGHFTGKQKSIEHKLNDAAHDLAYNF